MVVGYSVGDNCNAGLVGGAAPSLSLNVSSNCDGVVDLGVSERFIAAFIPPGPEVQVDAVAQLLFDVQSETVLAPALLAVRFDIGYRIAVVEERVDRLSITAHIGMVHKGENSD